MNNNFCPSHEELRLRASATKTVDNPIRPFTLILVAAAAMYSAHASGQQIYTVNPVGNGQDSANIGSYLQKCSGATACIVQLNPGIYSLTTGLHIPSNTTLTSMSSNRSQVTLFRDWSDAPSGGAYAGPLITMAGTPSAPARNVKIQYLSLNGFDHPPYAPDANDPNPGPTLNSNVNLLIQNCISCTVEGVDSSHSRLSSILLLDGNQNLTVDNCSIHDNGQPGSDPSARSAPFRSDGLTVTRVGGVSYVTYNLFWNNTDVDLILGGGMFGLNKSAAFCNPTSDPKAPSPTGATACMYVIGNTVNSNLQLTRLAQAAGQLDRSPLTGAGIVFDTENGWSPGCDKDYSCAISPVSYFDTTQISADRTVAMALP